MANNKKDLESGIPSNLFYKTFDKIKNIFGTGSKEIVSVEDKIKKSMANLNTIILNRDNYNYAETIKNALTSKIGTDNLNREDIFNQLVQSPEIMSRFIRYKNAEEVVQSISYCARALKVLTDSIITPDKITKDSLLIKCDFKENAELNKYLSNVKSINSILKIDENIYETIYNCLKYGDYFVEFCDYRSKEIPVTQSLYLTESKKNKNCKPQNFLKETYEVEMPTIKKESKTKDLISIKDIEFKNKPFVIEFITNVSELDKIIPETSKENNYDYESISSITTSILKETLNNKKRNIKESKEKEDDDLDNPSLRDIRLIFHNPKRVIKIQSERYRLNLGYIIIPVDVFGENSPYGFSATSTGNSNTLHPKFASINSLYNKELVGIDNIYRDLIKTIRKYVDDVDIKVNKKELKMLISRALEDIDQMDENNTLKIRYVPPERMIHWYNDVLNFFPYGESVFEKTMHDAKYLIAHKDAITIMRMTEASDKRLIYIDYNMTRDIQNIIEMFKEALRKRKYTLDNFGSIGAISSTITSYEDYILPSNKGRRYVEFDTLPAKVNVRDATDELKFFRDEVIASLDIPPAFLNIEENLSFCVARTYVELTNGQTILLKDMIDRFNNGEEFEVFSYDENRGVVFPNKVKWVGYTQRNVNCLRITLDNGKEIYVTPEHKMMLRNGEYVEANTLKTGDSLMPFYKELKPYVYSRKLKERALYYRIYHPGLNIWDWMHKSFASYCNIVRGNEHCHHIDMNTKNNSTNNLVGLTPESHCSLHSRTKDLTIEEINSLKTNRQYLFKLSEPGISYIKVNCKICDKEFYRPKVLNKVTCSPECMSEYHKKTGLMSWESRKDEHYKNYPIIELECDNCGTIFETTLTEKLKDRLENKSYLLFNCDNLNCAESVKNINIYLSKTNGKLYSEIEYKNCEICGKSFIYSDSKGKEQKVFKDVCYDINCINTKLARTHSNKRKNGKNLICSICGKEVYRPKSYIDNITHENLITCGRKECYNKSRSEISKLQPTTSKKRICVFCGDVYSVIESRKETQMCCGKEECKKKSYDNLFNNFRITKVCDYCGKEFTKPISWFKDRHGKYYSCGNKECSNYVKSLNTSIARKGNLEYIIFNKCVVCGKDIILSKNKPGYSTKTCGSKKCITTQVRKNKKQNNATEVLNHKVVKIEYLEEKVDCGDITVERFHNFALDAGVFVHNSNKSVLAHESSLYAETILGYQKRFGKHLRETFNSIHKYVYNQDIPKEVEISFIPPRMLNVERERENIDQAIGIIQSLTAEPISIPVEYAKTQYLDMIDWDKIKEYEVNSKLDQRSKPIAMQNTDMGMGGFGMNMGMGGNDMMSGMTGGGFDSNSEIGGTTPPSSPVSPNSPNTNISAENLSF